MNLPNPSQDWREQRRREERVRAVEMAVQKLEIANARLRNEMREAHKVRGASLRDIGAAAGMSHEKVRSIVTTPYEE